MEKVRSFKELKTTTFSGVLSDRIEMWKIMALIMATGFRKDFTVFIREP